MNRCATAVFAALMAMAWLALTLAELGCFNAWLCLAAGLAAGCVAWRCAAPEPDPNLKWALLIALASLILTLPPSEMILSNWDPGVYLHSAAAIARDGSLRWELSDFSALSGDERALVLRNYGGALGPFGGMWHLPDGRVSPQFFHLYPSLLAVAHSLGGVWAALLVNPLLNVACILALYALARTVVGDKWALAAALLLAVNPAQLWQARFSTSEMLTQLLLLGGLVGLARGSALAGAAFGLALLCRYDTIMFLVPLVAVLLVFWADVPNKKNAARSLLVFIPFAAQAYWHQKTFSPHYHPVSDLVWKAGLLAGGGLVIGLVLLYAPGIRLKKRLLPYAVWLKGLLAAGVVAVALFAWLVRPRGDDPEAGNMLYLAGLFGPLGLALALAGVVALIFKTRTTWQWAWVCASLTVTAILVANVFNDHFMMWVSRRFMPVVVPFFCLACLAAVRVFPRYRGALFLVTLALNIPATASVARTRDWPGLVAWFEKLAPRIPDQALVYCDQPGYAGPLRFLCGKRAFELYSREPDARERLIHLMEEKAGAGIDVWFLTMTGAPFTEVGKFPLKSHTLATAKTGVPRGAKPRGGDFVLYHVAAGVE